MYVISVLLIMHAPHADWLNIFQATGALCSKLKSKQRSQVPDFAFFWKGTMQYHIFLQYLQSSATQLSNLEVANNIKVGLSGIY